MFYPNSVFAIEYSAKYLKGIINKYKVKLKASL